MSILRRLPRVVQGASAMAFAWGLASAPACAEEAAGRWLGQLPSPVSLHVVLIITKALAGGYTGVLKTPDQGDQAIAATKVEASADHLVFTQADLHLTYDAQWDQGRKAWVGVFTQSGHAFPLALMRDDAPVVVAPAAAVKLDKSPLLAPVSGLDGDWGGALDLGPQKLRLVLHVRSEDKGVKGGVDIPDQGAVALPITALGRAADTVTFKIASLEVAFTGALSPDGGTLTGTFTQAGHDLPLKLERSAAAAAVVKLRRPQEEAIAAAPAPYREEIVAFDNPAAPGVRLAGTLTLPEGAGPFPSVVLISGSGRNARDEAVFDHKIFLVLADYLTRRGFAVLRYDKRGAGQSTGDYGAATSADFTSDAAAAVGYLKHRPDIARGKLGLIGHSEGGLIAPTLAASDPSLAFVVLMAGPGVPGRILIAEQQRLIDTAQGEPPAEAAQDYALNRRLFDAIATAKDRAEAKARVRDIMASVDPRPTAAEIDQRVKFADSEWVKYFLSYDPAPTLRQVRVPILVLSGSKDLQVPPALDLPPIRAALADNHDATIVEMPGLNHLFQHADTGAPLEYSRIDETLAPELLQTVADWIAGRVK